MNLTFLTDAQAMMTLKQLANDCIELECAVAWATKNEFADTLLSCSSKVTRIVIGTHLYQTDPEVLRCFMSVAGSKVLPPTGRLFHPKLYIFTMGQSMCAVIGSHNLTRGAFGGKNIEASVLIEGVASDKIFKQFHRFIAKGWDVAEVIDEDSFLFAYEKQYEANRRNRAALKKFQRLKKPLVNSSKPSPHDLNWDGFVARVKSDLHHSLEGRLNLLNRAGQLFTKRRTFAHMNALERKAIAGTYAPRETGLDGIDWGWFGSMCGQGDFKNLVNEPSELLSRALDHIPTTEEVTEDQYDAFIEDFNEAFKGKDHKGGIATASRLLTMKRPDQFVAVNDANRRGICNAFGVAHSTLRPDNYWERIVVPTMSTMWWQYPRPRDGLEGPIWDNRAAFLDSIYYTPK